MTSFHHIPVLLKESLENLIVKPNGTYVDATLGGGGHAKAILEAAPNVRLIGIDRDAEAIEAARAELKAFGDRVEFVHSNFSRLNTISELRNSKLDGMLFDLGLSSHQIDSGRRGFSFQTDAPLDMRMDSSMKISAKDIVNDSSPEELEKIIREYGEERYYRRVARAIAKARPLVSTLELADVIRRSIPGTSPVNKTKSVARVFQAFRIAVNGELESLKSALNDAIDLLAPKGRIVVISYHSLEDRIVKDFFKLAATGCVCPPKQPVCTCGHKKTVRIITKKPITPYPEETLRNPRARSAKLRAAEKL